MVEKWDSRWVVEKVEKMVDGLVDKKVECLVVRLVDE